MKYFICFSYLFFYLLRKFSQIKIKHDHLNLKLSMIYITSMCWMRIVTKMRMKTNYAPNKNSKLDESFFKLFNAKLINGIIQQRSLFWWAPVCIMLLKVKMSVSWSNCPLTCSQCET